MIKKLQRKFVLITVFSLFIVELAIIGAINGINIYKLNQNSNKLMNIIIDNDGIFPEFNKSGNPDGPPRDTPNDKDFQNDNKTNNSFDKGFDINEETKYITRYFNVKVDSSEEISSVDTGHIAAVTRDIAIEYAQKALDKGRDTGWFDNYKYEISDNQDGKLIVFLDCRSQISTMYQFIAISCSIGFLGLVVVSILVIVFSKSAIKPAVESMEKQKQFITDAGHEIKTPLAIISANTEVLEITNGECEWTDSIKNQTKRLADLIKNLLTLSKMDEEIKLVFEKFDISNAVFDVAYPFKTLAKTRQKDLSIDVQNDIEYLGDEGMIRQLVSILLDNAIKYADDNCEIQLSLKKDNKNIQLTVFNPCTEVANTDLSKLFDRFYRSDSSRSRETGGYGIGLSIASAIVDSHKGKISAITENNGIAFKVTLKP